MSDDEFYERYGYRPGCALVTRDSGDGRFVVWFHDGGAETCRSFETREEALAFCRERGLPTEGGGS